MMCSRHRRCCTCHACRSVDIQEIIKLDEVRVVALGTFETYSKNTKKAQVVESFHRG